MRKWTTYAITAAVFFGINVFLLYLRSASIDLWQSLMITGVFLLVVLTLDGVSALIKNRHSN